MTSRDSDKFMLRLPEGMRNKIEAAAKTNGRSMNSEIVSSLSEKFGEPSLGNESPDATAALAFLSRLPPLRLIALATALGLD